MSTPTGDLRAENDHDDERDDAHEADEGREEGGAAAPTRRVQRARTAAPQAREVPHIGLIPARARWWGVERRNAIGEWDRLTAPDASGDLETNEWPLAELSLDAVRSRFGAGTFRIAFWGVNPNGSRVFVSRSREITIRPEVGAAPPAAVVPSALAPTGPMGEAFALMDLIERRATGQLAAMTQLAQLARGDGGSSTLNVVVEMMRTQREETRELIAAMREESRAERQSLRALLADEDEPAGGGVAGAAANAVATVARARRPQSLKGLLLGAVADNPALIGDALRTLPAVLESLKGMAEMQAQRQPAPAPPVQVQHLPAQPPPRRVERAQPAPAAVDATPGINAAAASAPPPPPNGAAS